MDLRSIDAYATRKRSRMDDVTLSVFVENELKVIVPQMYDRLFPELDARKHIPIGTNVAAGAMAWAYDSADKRGKAKFLGANATDMPRADVSKKRQTFPIRTIVSSYGWSIEEIEAAKFAGTPLDAMKAEAARRAIAELEHEVLLFGDVSRNLPGFLTNPATPLVVLPNGDWLATATPDEVIADLNALVDQIWIGTDKVHRANTLLLPLPHFRHIQTTRIPDTDIPIVEFFRRSNPEIREILPLTELISSGAGGTPQALAYQKDPGMQSGVIPLAFQQLEAQAHGFEVVVPVRERVGGTVWYYPFSGAFGIGL